MIGPRPLVPQDFVVPDRAETTGFVLRPLTWAQFPLLCESTAAVGSPRGSGPEQRDPEAGTHGLGWPGRTTPERAALLAAWAQIEATVFRSSFTYLALDPTQTRHLGTACIGATTEPGLAVECRVSPRAGEMVGRPFDGAFYGWLRDWLADGWPFENGHVAWSEWGTARHAVSNSRSLPNRGAESDLAPLIWPPRLVPDGFGVPTTAQSKSFVLVPLEGRGFVLDYESYMSSVPHLQATFRTKDGPFDVGGSAWPAGTSLDAAYLDAAWCEMEFLLASSFSYVVLTLDKTQQLGAAYIWPSRKQGYDVDCQSWVRADHLDAGVDQEVYAWFRAWVNAVWPFDPNRVAWPGREISWEQWDALPDKQALVSDRSEIGR